MMTFQGRMVPQPLRESALWGWYDFSAPASITAETGGRIAQVADLSGNGRNLVSSGAARPYYGARFIQNRNAADFQAGQYLWFPAGAVLGNTDVTIACVYVNDIATQGALITGRSTVGPYALRIMSHPATENTALGVIHNTNLGQSTVAGAKVNTPSYGGLVRSGASVYGFCNGVTGNSGIAADYVAVGQMTMGGWTDGSIWNFMLDGAVGEMLIYSRALSAAELGRLTAYLIAKWGL